MNPKQVSQRLLQIAAKINNSKNPRKDLVAADLKQVLAVINNRTAASIHYTLRNDVDDGMIPEDDGSLTVELEKLLMNKGASIEEWDASTGLVINVSDNNKEAVEDLLWSIRNKGNPGSKELADMLALYEPA